MSSTYLRRARLQGLHSPAQKLELALGELGGLSGGARARRFADVGHGRWYEGEVQMRWCVRRAGCRNRRLKEDSERKDEIWRGISGIYGCSIRLVR